MRWSGKIQSSEFQKDFRDQLRIANLGLSENDYGPNNYLHKAQ
ncbi:unnamed protein product [Arabidopsis halleri]